MNRTRIKICGITRPEDGLAAAELGADAIGLVFYPQSARWVDIPQAQAIVRALPPFITTVGLFVDPTAADVQAVLRWLPLSLLQFHGDETPEDCARFELPFIKAVPMGSGVDIKYYERRFERAAALLLDSHDGITQGGSGRVFDWAMIPPGVVKPIILAGGLNPQNISQAVKRIRPFAVDVSSGVESTKGIKDAALIEQFIEGVDRGDYDARAH